nr:hypothetical protein Q903MT_gene5125 [Picea sitchensis]
MKEREVKKFIQEQGLSFCGLIESKVKECKKEGVLNAIGRSWNVFCNYGSSPNGRIWLCWNPRDVDVIFISHSDQVIHCRVFSSSKTWSCVVSVVSWDNCRVRRTELWADIEASSVGFEGTLWLLLGDLNAIRKRNQAMGGSLDWPTWKNDLDECISWAGLEDLRYGGFYFTWSNRRDEDPTILRKLDRALINMEWESSLEGSDVQFLPPGVSDHSPLVVKLADLPRAKIPFKFFDFWADHPDFLHLVASVWEETVVGTFPGMGVLHLRINL